MSILGLALVVFGADSTSRTLQTWYAKIFRAEVHGWKARARRAQWLAGVFGFLALQVVIGRRVEPATGHIAASAAQFLLAVAFWWWSLHCLLAGQIPWRRLLPAGLATAACYTAVGIYIAYFASSSIISNEATYGPIGAVMTLLTIEIGLTGPLSTSAPSSAPQSEARQPRKTHHPTPSHERPHQIQLDSGLRRERPRTRPDELSRRGGQECGPNGRWARLA